MTPDLWIAMAVCLWAPAIAAAFGLASGTVIGMEDDYRARLATRFEAIAKARRDRFNAPGSILSDQGSPAP